MMSISDVLSRPAASFAGLALAAVAILLWSLRTAPGTASDDNEMPEQYVRGLVVRAVIGLIGVLAGAYAVLTDHVAWSLPLFAVGFGLWLRLVRQNGRRRHSSPGLRRIVDFADSALHASLLAGVLIVGNLLGFKYGGVPIDLTRERSFSLSTTTRKQLADLDRPLTLTVFHNRSQLAMRQLDRVNQLLELYQSAAPKLVKVELLDRYNEPDRYEKLAKQLPDVAVIPDGGVVLTYGAGEKADRLLVRNSDMFNLSANSNRVASNEFSTEFNGEDVITSAIVRMRQGDRPLIAFTTGHGETPLGDDPRTPALSILKNRLEAVGSQVATLDLGVGEIHSNTKLVIIAGPRTSFSALEIARLQRAIDKSIPVLFLIDPSVKTGLEDFLRAYQVEVGSGLVLDPRNSYQGQARMVIAQVGGASRQPIVDSLSGRRVLVPSAGPLRPLPPSANVKVPLRVDILLATSTESWAESAPERLPVSRDLKEDVAGPISIGLAVSEPGKTSSDPVKPKLVVFSSAYLADNPFVEIAPTNLDLVMNAATWLRGRPDQIGISPKTHVALTLAVNPGMRARLVIVPTIMSAVIIIGLGVGTYLARRV